MIAFFDRSTRRFSAIAAIGTVTLETAVDRIFTKAV
jgi:hypothetical protein